MRIQQEEKERIYIKTHIFKLIIVHMVLFFVSIVLEEKNIQGVGIIIGLVLHLVGAIMVFVILQKIGNAFTWRENTLFGQLTIFSMTIYLFHQQIIYIVIACLNGKINPYVNAAINYFIAIIGSLIIGKILKKFKLTTFLIGEK